MRYLNHLNEEITEADYLQFRDDFLVKIQKIVDDSMRNYSWECEISVTKGRRYDRIVKEDVATEDKKNCSTSVWGFIDKTNGNILKAESWKKPSTKNTRGNIYEDERMLFCGPYGPAYMDTIKEYYGA